MFGADPDDVCAGGLSDHGYNSMPKDLIRRSSPEKAAVVATQDSEERRQQLEKKIAPPTAEGKNIFCCASSLTVRTSNACLFVRTVAGRSAGQRGRSRWTRRSGRRVRHGPPCHLPANPLGSDRQTPRLSRHTGSSHHSCQLARRSRTT